MTLAKRNPSRPSRVERNRNERLVTEPLLFEKTLKYTKTKIKLLIILDIYRLQLCNFPVVISNKVANIFPLSSPVHKIAPVSSNVTHIERP